MWAPPAISWLKNPSNYRYKYHKPYWKYKPTLRFCHWGAPHDEDGLFGKIAGLVTWSPGSMAAGKLNRKGAAVGRWKSAQNLRWFHRDKMEVGLEYDLPIGSRWFTNPIREAQSLAAVYDWTLFRGWFLCPVMFHITQLGRGDESSPTEMAVLVMWNQSPKGTFTNPCYCWFIHGYDS